MNPYHLLLCLLLLLISSNHSFAQSNAEKGNKKIKVYLLGTFHFAQTEDKYDILEDKHQENILELCNLIVKQKPNKVFVERQPEYEFQNKVNKLFNRYKENDTIPYKNEIYQVGFRVAKRLGHPQVYQCDNPGFIWKIL